MAERLFAADESITKRTVQPQRKIEKGHGPDKPMGRGKEMEAQTLWAMLYADDAGIVSRSPNGLERMMTVIMTDCMSVSLSA